jgi:hypothetical protein
MEFSDLSVARADQLKTNHVDQIHEGLTSALMRPGQLATAHPSWVVPFQTICVK